MPGYNCLSMLLANARSDAGIGEGDLDFEDLVTASGLLAMLARHGRAHAAPKTAQG